MILSDSIAKLIEKMLEDGDGCAEVKRNDMASKLGCVPSQISYVITSRFTPERGYTIESHRGGGGYIRIVRANMSRSEYLMHFFHAIGDCLSERDGIAYTENLRDHGFITQREALLTAAALSEGALDCVVKEKRNILRADIMRHIIMALMS